MARKGHIAEFNMSDGFTPQQIAKLNHNFRELLVPGGSSGSSSSQGSDLDTESTIYSSDKIPVSDDSGNHYITVASLQDYLGLSLDKQVRFGSTSYWNSQLTLQSEEDMLYVYTDHAVDSNGNNLAGIKVGDGGAYVVDLPFIDSLFTEHIMDDDIHVSAADRAAWNAKVRCYYTGVEQLVFTTN